MNLESEQKGAKETKSYESLGFMAAFFSLAAFLNSSASLVVVLVLETTWRNRGRRTRTRTRRMALPGSRVSEIINDGRSERKRVHGVADFAQRKPIWVIPVSEGVPRRALGR